jgi:prepilin-type N-terminal cleavage/methylation domain-containing protein
LLGRRANPPLAPPYKGGESEQGFTLLEIILALAILAGSLAVLGEIMRLGDRSASMTESETQAQILTESLLDELASGARQLSVVNQAVLDPNSNPPWLYSISVDNTDYQELVSVRVAVEQQLEARLQPTRFEIVRWMANPNYTPPNANQDSSTTTDSSTSSSSSSGGAATNPSGGGQQ